jgi:hypothetical protein
MDGYSGLAWGGVERVVDAFFADKPESVIPLPGGTCIVRRARDPSVEPHWTIRPLPSGVWVEAGGNGLRTALREGWSGLEDWGVWGVGASHALALGPSAGPVRLEVDCATAMLGPTEWQAVTISAGGKALDVWQFTRAQNRAIRSVTIPASKKGATVVFHPSEPLLRPCDHEAGSTDDRALGLAVHRVRLSA